MKAVFIPYNQAYYMEIVELFERNGCRGYTKWSDIGGRGSRDGEPHEGSHGWPTMNDAVMAFVDDDKIGNIMCELKAKDEETPELGLRAFVWSVEDSI